MDYSVTLSINHLKTKRNVLMNTNYVCIHVGHADNKLISYSSGCTCVGHIATIVLYVNINVYI